MENYYDQKMVNITVTCPYCKKGVSTAQVPIDKMSNSLFVEFPQCSNKCRQTRWGFQVRYGFIVGDGQEMLHPNFTSV